MLPDDTRFITDEASLRALHHQPMLRVTDKVLRGLDKYCRRIISLSPFCIVATQGPNGADVSPRGDPAGFARVLDDRTLLVTRQGVTSATCLPSKPKWHAIRRQLARPRRRRRA